MFIAAGAARWDCHDTTSRLLGTDWRSRLPLARGCALIVRARSVLRARLCPGVTRKRSTSDSRSIASPWLEFVLGPRIEALQVLHDLVKRDADGRCVGEQPVDEWPQLAFAVATRRRSGRCGVLANERADS